MDISQFDLHAQIEDIHWWFKGKRAIIFEILRRYVPINQTKMLAEIGCGTGGNLKFFKDYYLVVGVDSSPEAVGYASERVACSVFLGDFRDVLADRWQHIDAVLLADVLEHIEDDAGFLKDIVDPLKPGAVIMITVPAHMFLWSHHDVVLGHKRRYSAESLRSLWKNLEVEQLKFSPFDSILFPAIALKRLLKPVNPDSGKSDLYLPSPWINYLLCKIFSFERILMRLFPLPFGVSYVAALRKKAIN